MVIIITESLKGLLETFKGCCYSGLPSASKKSHFRATGSWCFSQICVLITSLSSEVQMKRMSRKVSSHFQHVWHRTEEVIKVFHFLDSLPQVPARIKWHIWSGQMGKFFGKKVLWITRRGLLKYSCVFLVVFWLCFIILVSSWKVHYPVILLE